MKTYFKVYQDFSRYIPIDETEYEKALYAFKMGKGAIFEAGAVSRIEGIFPDLNRMNGWNSDYKQTQDDNNEIERARLVATKFAAKTKERVDYLIATKQEHLIGKGVEIPELETPTQHKLSGEIKNLASTFKAK